MRTARKENIRPTSIRAARSRCLERTQRRHVSGNDADGPDDSWTRSVSADSDARWVDVTPMVFIMNTAVSVFGFLGPAVVATWLPEPAQSTIWVSGILAPPVMNLFAWRAYSSRVGMGAQAGRVGW